MKVDLETVRLRRLARSDGPAIRAGLEDGKCARNMSSIPHPYPEGEEYEFIERVRTRAFGIFGYLDGIETLFGTCGLYNIPEVHSEGEYHFGYMMIYESYWNQGIGTHAVKLLLKTAPQDGRIFASVMNDNPASMRVFEKLGFVKCGEGSCDSKGRGEVVPTTLFELKR